MSISSRQNFWNPPPVPEMPTVTRALVARLELLGHGFGDRKDRAGAVDLDDRGRREVRFTPRSPAAARGCGHRQPEHEKRSHHGFTLVQP